MVQEMEKVCGSSGLFLLIVPMEQYRVKLSRILGNSQLETKLEREKSTMRKQCACGMAGSNIKCL